MRGKIVLGFLVLLLAAIATRSDAAKYVYHPYSPYYYHPFAAPVVVHSQLVPSNTAQGATVQAASAQSAALNGVLGLLIDRLANKSGGGSANTGGSTTACQNLTASVDKLSNSVDKLNSLLGGVATPVPNNNSGGTSGFNPVPGSGLNAALQRFGGAQGAAAQGAAAQGDSRSVTYRDVLDVLAKQEKQPDREQFLKWALANELIDGKTADARKAKVDAMIKLIDAVQVP